MNRRDFLFGISLAGPLVALRSFPFAIGDDDETLCTRKFAKAVSLSLQSKPINDVIIAMGKTFLGTEYVAYAIEVPGEERLVVNLRGLDCVSFYENALVFARCIKLNRTTFEDYKDQLQYVRYRGGVINGYLSRLHYTADYVYDNAKKGVWKDVTEELGGIPYEKQIDFMSTHPASYRQLKENAGLINELKKIEEEITGRKKFYIPKDRLSTVGQKIQSGDILGITTSIEGLDVSHTGIAIRENGVLKYMHAPNVGKTVQITDGSLEQYLAGNSKQTGVIVARVLEP